MPHTNYYGRAVYATADARDAGHRMLEDWIDATVDAEPFDCVQDTITGGVTDFPNMHLGDSVGPGLAYSYRISDALVDTWAGVLQAAVADPTEDHVLSSTGLPD